MQYMLPWDLTIENVSHVSFVTMVNFELVS